MKRILSVGGGGAKGILPTYLLAELEKRSGKPAGQLFDMIAGTSVGGIIGAGLSLGMKASDMLGFFLEDGPHIFKHGWFTDTLDLLHGPRFTASQIEIPLQKRFGVAKLRDCTVPFLTPAMDIGGTNAQPFFFKSYDMATMDYFVWQATRATSAAQTYFPAYETDGHVFWDGGIIANNPAMCALADAVKLWGVDTDFKVLSLGCGVTPSRFDAHYLADAGIAHVGMATLQVMLEGPSDAVDYQMTQLLGNSYYRIQPELATEVAMDDASSESTASLTADAVAAIAKCGTILDEFVS